MVTPVIHLTLRRFAELSPGDRQRLHAHLNAEDEATLVRHPAARELQALARGLLKEVLGQAMSCEPHGLRFERSAHGKPFLAQEGSPAFNLSHSQEAIAIAWSAGPLQLGVDIEDCSRQRQAELLARRKFSPAEVRAWEDAPLPQLQWLATWTRKEALLKANGLGIRIDLTTVDTLALPHGEFRHEALGQMRWQSWHCPEQVLSLAWSPDAPSTPTILHDLPTGTTLADL